MPEHVLITDVSPRDGLQNEPGVISTADKVRLIELLCATGVDEIEVTSFVSAKWVPQLGDAEDLVEQLRLLNAPSQREGVGGRAEDGTTRSGTTEPATPGRIGHEPTLPRAGAGTPSPRPPPSGRGLRTVFSALVPNERGLQGVLNINARADSHLISKVSVFTAASETFARKNTNASIAETIERFRPIAHAAKREGLHLRGYISCVIACPFEGPIATEQVMRVAADLINLGVTEIDLGDTIGAGTPESVGALLDVYRRTFPIEHAQVPVTLHLHDTHGRAAEGVRTALQMGVRSFDGSVAGLGGCPYASTKLPDGTIQRAAGNISTETLVRTIHDAGYTTGVDLAALEHAAAFARAIVAMSRAGGNSGAATP